MARTSGKPLRPRLQSLAPNWLAAHILDNDRPARSPQVKMKSVEPARNQITVVDLIGVAIQDIQIARMVDHFLHSGVQT